MSGQPGGGRLAPAAAFSTAVAFAGYRRGALSRSGAAGAVLVGTSTYLAGGWRWSAVLLTFFASSSALGRLEDRSPSGPAIAAMAARGARRDLVQALANGGVAACAALAHALRPRPVLAAAFAGAFAAAAADTWATEIGGLSRTPPRHILTGAEVPPGTSGGVTAAGLAGAAAGATTIAAVAALALGRRPSPRLGLAVAAAGLCGSLLDSVAGATLQAGYRCPACGESTERTTHRCGTATILVRGRPWCTNDVVNLLCTIAGAAIAGAGSAGEPVP